MHYFLYFIFIGSLLITGCDSPKTHQNSTITATLNNIQKKKLSLVEKKAKLQQLFLANKKLSTDSIKNTNYLKIAYLAYKIKDSILFTQANTSAFNLSIKLKDTNALAEIYWNKALFNNQNNNTYRAYANYHKAYSCYKHTNNKYYAGKMLYNMAFIQGRLKDYTGAEYHLFKALENFEPLKKYKNIYLCNSLLGSIYKDLNEYEKSITYHKKALSVLKITENKNKYLTASYNDLGVTYRENKKYTEALNYFHKALQLSKDHKIKPSLILKIETNIALTSLLKGKLDHVEQNLIKNLKKYEHANNILGQSYIFYCLAHFYLKLNDQETANKFANKALVLAQKINNNNYILKCYLLLSEIYPNQQNNYLKQYIALSKKIATQDRQARYKLARINYETDIYKKRIKTLSYQKYFILIFSIFVLSIILFSYYLYRQRTRNKLYKLQDIQQEEDAKTYKLLLKYRKKITDEKNNERLRIAEELHDGVLCQLFGVRFNLSLFKVAEEKQAKYNAYLNELQKAEIEIRNISHNLTNNLVVQLKYFEITKRLIIEQSKVGGYAYTIDAKDATTVEDFNYIIKINMYRVLQEILININKHSKATQVDFEMYVSDNQNLVVTVIDNGIGFHLKKGKRGIGLYNITSRIKKINGIFKIETAPNKGTKIKITVPIT